MAPELRRKPPELAFAGRPGVVIEVALSVREAGFSLHAATRAGAFDEGGREALLDTSCAHRWPTIGCRRASGGLVRIALKKPFSATTQEASSCAPCEASTDQEPVGSRYRPWAEPLKRAFEVDVEICPRCGGAALLSAHKIGEVSCS